MSRSVKKGPFVNEKLLLKVKNNKKNKIIKTHSRESFILPEFVGHKIAVYNGKKYIVVSISEDMVTHKLGEFSSTRTFHGHSKEDKRNKK